ncbi:hypothetical protein CYMTET_20829 [Cymbomonas tetramitiformis]|uniref:SMP-LTD domain-containing protein n=1 Tax=Cymbomonas tetramitiformis TaxID=36881 RepID=A0AAE0G3S0_9CHLO|nr:hypothetical protein CYMTET_20829 [Cymbomonas tetramitiformis]
MFSSASQDPENTYYQTTQYESVEWLNDLMSKMWPFISKAVERICRETVEPAVEASLPKALHSFKFRKVDLGRKPLRVEAVELVSKNEKSVCLTLDLVYDGDSGM